MTAALDAAQSACAADYWRRKGCRKANELARRYPRFEEPLRGAVSLAVVDAAGRWDPGHPSGTPFDAYASARIRARVVDALRFLHVAKRDPRRAVAIPEWFDAPGRDAPPGSDLTDEVFPYLASRSAALLRLVFVGGHRVREAGALVGLGRTRSPRVYHAALGFLRTHSALAAFAPDPGRR